MSSYISYWDLLKSRDQFRKSGGRNVNASEFNYYDTPGHKYFKIFFYFDNGDSIGEGGLDNGLLTPTWLEANMDDKTYYMYNSAWSYLKMNDDDGRAALVEKFVNLLSNISSESPWYFSEISGLDAALERKQPMSNTFSIEEARPKISIKCLPDSFDDRIGTLLDLYRAIVWDWSTKREILPANLRKFDMGIFIFETTTAMYHDRKQLPSNMRAAAREEYTYINGGADGDKSSCKYIEFHNCEIDYNSSKNLYSNLNNKEGFSAEYTIDIHFDDCYESRYNDFLIEEFGDIILKSETKNEEMSSKITIGHSGAFDKYANFTLNGDTDKIAQTWDFNKADIEGTRLKGFPPAPKFQKGGFLVNMVDQLIDTGLDKANSLLKKAVLGNLYTFSLTRIGNQIKSLAQGNVIGAVRDVQGYINNANVKEKQHFDQSRLSPEPSEPTLPTILEDHNLFTNGEYYLGTAGGNMFSEVATPTEHKVTPLYEKANVQKTELSPSFFPEAAIPTEHEVTSIPGEVKPSPIHQQSEMFPRGTQAWAKSSGGVMFEKKKIKPSVKYIGNMFEGSSIVNNL